MTKARLLVVDDDRSVREFLPILLSRWGYRAVTAASAEDALAVLAQTQVDLILSDLNLPGMSGIELLEHTLRVDSDLMTIMISAYGDTENVVKAVKNGAYDFITKPFRNDELQLLIERALKTQTLARENRTLHSQLKSTFGFDSIIGRSDAMQRLFDLMHRVKDTRINVLISGETGTGKELVARAMHFNSERRKMPFCAVNCGAIPEELMESELFGHVRGSFTGAHRDKQGLFQAADGGTLFLDEVGELPLRLQVKLLRALQEKRVKRVGDTREVEIDVRVISATNRDLEAEVKSGHFREDLFYRLNVVGLELPPLRERGGDIDLLVRYFIDKANREFGKRVRGFDRTSLALVGQHEFPGNVRELENLIERCVALSTGDWITEDVLPGRMRRSGPPQVQADRGEEPLIPETGTNLDVVMNGIEHAYLKEALARTGGRKKKAAELLGISFRSFRYRLAKYETEEE